MNLPRFSWWDIFDTWPFDRVEAFDRGSDLFEARCRANPDISTLRDLIDNVPAEERIVWLSELLAIHISVASENGVEVTLADLQQRFPENRETVGKVWAETAAFVTTCVPSLGAAGYVDVSKGRYLRPSEVLAGRYRVVDFVSAGGMGELYRGERMERAWPVALKVVVPSPNNAKGRTEEWFEQRGLRELDIQQRLRHPHLVAAFDLIREDGRPPVIVMDWVDGQTLQELVKRHGPMGWRLAAAVISQAALGLGDAQKRIGLVHRDIKPSNLMLTSQGDVKVLDFGLAKITLPDGDVGPTIMGEVFGTPGFVAPEQLSSAANVTAAADVYSLGRMFAYLVNGSMQPVANSPLLTAVPVGLGEIIEQMTSVAPETRPADGLEVAALLQPWTVGADLKRWYHEGSESEPDVPPVQPLSETVVFDATSGMKRRAVLGAAVAGFASLAGGFVWRRSVVPAPVVPVLERFGVTLYREEARGSFRTVGELGAALGRLPVGGRIRVDLRYSVPVSVQILLAEGDGRVRVVCGDGVAAGTDAEALPDAVKTVRFPRDGHWQLERGGFLAIIAVARTKSTASAVPLVARLAELRWKPKADQSGLWRIDGNAITQVETEDEEVPRGIVAAVPQALREWLDAVEAIAGEGAVLSGWAAPVDS